MEANRYCSNIWKKVVLSLVGACLILSKYEVFCCYRFSSIDPTATFCHIFCLMTLLHLNSDGAATPPVEIDKWRSISHATSFVCGLVATIGNNNALRCFNATGDASHIVCLSSAQIIWSICSLVFNTYDMI
jgi:hypothetical protein